MDYVLIAIWVICPLVFFLLALWSYLEQSTVRKTGKKANREPYDLFKQGLFVSACSVVAWLIDTFLIQAGSLDWIFGEWIPKPLVRFLLYPLILYAGAMLTGGSAAPRIEKLPRPSEKYKHGRKK
jgi:hypothetical protein